MDKEVSELDRKLFLRKTYLDKIYYHINRNPINQEELYSLIRKFFGEYLKLDYEFTYEELSSELNKIFITPKVKEHIDEFLIRLSESEYLEETILGTTEINGYLEELGDIIKNIIYDDQPVRQSESIVQKVLKRHKEPAKVLDVSGISALIEETNFHITNGHIDIAKSSYVNLLKAFDGLSKDDKQKLHDDLNEVYERLQTLIKNPKSQIELDKKSVKTYTTSESIKKVRDLADDTLYYINASNAESAKRKYADTLNLYESLNPEEKSVLHSRINDIYTQLQAMLSVTTYVEGEQITGLENPVKSSSVDKRGLEQSESHDVALNMDLSALSPISASFTTSTTTKTDTSLNEKDSALNDTGTIGADLSNMDLSIVSTVSNDFNSDIASASNVKVDNRLSKPNTVSSTDFSAPIPDSIDNQQIKSMNNLFMEPSDDKVQTGSASKATTQISNELFNASTLNDSVKPIQVQTDKEHKPSIKSNIQNPAASSNINTKTRPSIIPEHNMISAQIDAEKDIKSDKDTMLDKTIKSEIIKPSTTYTQVSLKPEIQPSIDKLNRMLKNIDDNMVMDKFDKAKSTYKEALLLYRSMSDENKVKCYENFYGTFKRLDEAMHQKSLHDILDKHLSDAEESHRPISLAPNEDRGKNLASSESLRIARMTTLPVMLANDPDVTRVYELIEESYFNIDNKHSDLAMLKYFKALELYHKLPLPDKKKLYSNLYDLFKKLSIVKRI